MDDAEHQFKWLAGYADLITNSSVVGEFGYNEKEEKVEIPQPFSGQLMKDHYENIRVLDLTLEGISG